MAAAIETAIQGLITQESVDLETAKQALEKEILVGKAMLEKGQGIYTDSSWTAYINAVNNAIQISDKEDAVSTEVNGAANQAKEAFRNLTVKVDTSYVEAKKEFQSILSVLNTILGKGQGNYTDTSWNAFKDTLAQGSALAARPSAEKADMLAMSQKLRLAANGLQLKPVTPPTVELPKPGTTFSCKGLKYKVRKATEKEKTVSVVGAVSKSVKKITIPSEVNYKDHTFKVDYIRSSSFRNLKKLESVSIGRNVTAIGSRAFQNCNMLSSVKIGKGITSIGNYAFYGSEKKLKYVQIYSVKLSKVGKKAFYQSSSNGVIKVPSSKLSAYKKILKDKGIKKVVKF